MSQPYPEEVRETFGWFGAAVHNAQFFESDLVSLHMVVAGIRGKATTFAELKDLETALSLRTLGQLLRNLEQIAPVPETTQMLWKRALVSRNELSHGFFWKNLAIYDARRIIAQ